MSPVRASLAWQGKARQIKANFKAPRQLYPLSEPYLFTTWINHTSPHLTSPHLHFQARNAPDQIIKRLETAAKHVMDCMQQDIAELVRITSGQQGDLLHDWASNEWMHRHASPYRLRWMKGTRVEVVALCAALSSHNCAHLVKHDAIGAGECRILKE